MRRRGLAALAGALALGAAAPPPAFEVVRPGVPLVFPRDHGAHPGYHTEWWYVTGWLDVPGEAPKGFQITFFRTATGIAAASRSAFAPRQILFAHAALSDAATGHLLHGQRIAREGLGLARAATNDADVTIDDWRFRRRADGRYAAHVVTADYALDLVITPTQPILPEGEDGYSRKGPAPGQASRYYSQPHLTVAGVLTRGGQAKRVAGTAWLDREWSSTYLMPGAVGWDWTGLNLADSAALMAFRIRGQDGRTLWAGGTWRDAAGRRTVLRPQDVRFRPRHLWQSRRTGARYPVDPVIDIRLAGGWRTLPLTPLMPDQELDSRASGGPVYWEGAVRVPGGRGYLELTGYGSKLRL